MGLFGGGNTKTQHNTDSSSRNNQGQFSGMVEGDDNWVDVESVDSEVVEAALDGAADISADAFSFAETNSEEAFSFGSDAIDGMADLGSDAFASMEDVAKNAFDFGESGFAFGEDVLSSMEELSGNAFDFGSDAISAFTNSQENIIGDSFHTVETLAGKAFDFGEESVEALERTNLVNMEAMAGLVSNQAAANSQQLQTMAQLAKTTTESAVTGGQSVVAENASKMLMYVMGGFAVIAVVGLGVVMVKGK